jgi:PBP1b-binding outer membrane lipoprotein LpoB
MMVKKIVVLAAVLILSGCSGSGEVKSVESDTPEYRIVEPRNRTIVVEVDGLPTEEQMRGIFDEVVAGQTKDGGQSVLINCSTGGTESVDNRLANGRFAIGQLGAAQTGLEAGDSEFSVNSSSACPK